MLQVSGQSCNLLLLNKGGINFTNLGNFEWIWSFTCLFVRMTYRFQPNAKCYDQCLLPLLLYGCETWTLYQHQIRQLRTIQQRHLRRIGQQQRSIGVSKC